MARFWRDHLRTFSAANVTAIVATAADFLTLIALVEGAGLHYVKSTACGAVVGAVTNFLLNRYWAFKGEEQTRIDWQFGKYVLVSTASLGLNTLGVYVFTELSGILYVQSKAITAVLVGWLWNYPLHKYFVFRNA